MGQEIGHGREEGGAYIHESASISERTAQKDGKQFADFEMDTTAGKDGHRAGVTLTERRTNMLSMRKLNGGKNAKELPRTVIRLLAPSKGHVKSVTTDSGTEFACHEITAESTGEQVFFADTYRSWQKGAIENADGPIRQHMPKATYFADVTR